MVLLGGVIQVTCLGGTSIQMDVKCQECGAFKFKREPPGFCCSNGKIKIAPYPKPPSLLSELWVSQDSMGNLLRKYAREINNAVAISSVLSSSTVMT